MTWTEWSVVADWVGTLIVIISVFYLARQLRLNRMTNLIAGSAVIADAVRDIHLQLTGNSELFEIFHTGVSNSEKLSEIQRHRFEVFWWGVLRTMESFHAQHEQGVIDERTLLSYANFSIQMLHSNDIMVEHWRKNADDYSPRFKAWVNSKLDQASTAEPK